MTTLLIKQVLIMFILAAVGYLCFRAKKITMEGCRTISNILIYLSLPCVIINSFLVDFSKEKLMGLLYSSLAAAVVMIICIVVSRLFFSKDAILNFASAFSNPGFFGIPLIVATLSDGAVFLFPHPDTDAGPDLQKHPVYIRTEHTACHVYYRYLFCTD